MHEAGDRALELAAVDHDRRVHREQVVFAGMIDMEMRVQNVTDIAELQAVSGELVLDHILMELQPSHAERFHDRIVAVAGIDQHRILAAEDQIAVDRHAPGPPAFMAEHQEARLELDVAIVR